MDNRENSFRPPRAHGRGGRPRLNHQPAATATPGLAQAPISSSIYVQTSFQDVLNIMQPNHPLSPLILVL
jgi:hypothetical protein